MYESNSNGLQLFNFNNSSIRVIIQTNGEPLFVAIDVCKILGLDQVSNALKRLDEDEVISINLTDNLGRLQKTNLVNESGLYSLVLGSKKPEAKAFKKWVTSEVLPAIRKTGSYHLPQKSTLEMLADGFAQMARLEKEQAEQSEELKAIIEKQSEAEAHLEQIAQEPISTLQIETRKAFDDLIRSYAVRNSIDVSVIFNRTYKEFSLRYNIDVFHKAKRSKKSIIGWIESNGFMTQVYEVAKSILCRP